MTVRRTFSVVTACLVVLAGCSDIAAQLSGPQSSEPLESVGGQPQPGDTGGVVGGADGGRGRAGVWVDGRRVA